MTLPTRRTPRLAVHQLEDRTAPAVGDLYISEVHFGPIFGSGDTDQYLEIRGQPGATIAPRTYLAVVDGDAGTGGSGDAGRVNALFDLGGVQLGSDGYLVIVQAGSNYAIRPTATVLQGTTVGFGGFPGNRFSDNSTLSDRFDFIFGANTFVLFEASTRPAAGTDYDTNEDGVLDGAARNWRILDSVGVVGTFVGPDPTEIGYGRINFAVGGVGKLPAGSTVVPSTSFGYVARVGESTGYAPTDWVAGLPFEDPADSYQFRLESSIFGHPTIGFLAGRALDHLGAANFVAPVSGVAYGDANANGAPDPGEVGLPGVTVFADRNGNRVRDTYTTTVEPDQFAQDTDLTNAVPGVTLTEADTQNVQRGRSVTASLDAGSAVTGQLIFGRSGINWFDDNSRLRMDFYNPVRSISIDFRGGSLVDYFGRLSVFDAAGNLLDSYLSPAIRDGRTETLTVTRPTADIAFAVAYSDPAGFPFGLFDNLRFTAPEEAAVSGPDGSYLLNLQDGSYTVRPVRPAGFAPTDPQQGFYDVTITNSQAVRGRHFGFAAGGALFGQLLAVGGDAGLVTVYPPGPGGLLDAGGGVNLPILPTITPFDGVLRTATGDINGDGVEDVVVVTGPGSPLRFSVIDGNDLLTVLVFPTAPFTGSENFSGGGFVAVGDIDGDGRAEIAVTPDVGGGPRVSIFSLTGGTLRLRANFLGIDDPNFRGGARPAIGDVDGDGTPDVVVAAGTGGGPRVALFDGSIVLGARIRLTGDFYAFEQSLRDGVFVAVGDVDGDGFGDLIFGGGPGGAPRVLILNGQTVMTPGPTTALMSPIDNFFVAGNEEDRGGVRVATKDIDGDRLADVVVGSGEGSPARVRLYPGKTLGGGGGEPTFFQDLLPFGGFTLTNGVFVG